MKTVIVTGARGLGAHVAGSLISLVLDDDDIKSGQMYDVNDLLKGSV